MHILYLTHYYPPEVNAPAARISETAKAWVRAGHQVTVVTSAPNHPRGRPFPGYGNPWLSREMRDGVSVLRIWTYLARNSGVGRRSINFLSYPLSVLLHLPQLPKADVVISSSGPLLSGLSGFLVKRRRRPWILEIRDLWPESIVAVGAMKRGPMIRAFEWLERFAYRKADGIVSVTESFVPHIAARGGGPIAVIKNGVDLDFYSTQSDPAAGEALRRELGLEGKIVATYVGTHGMAHGLDTLLDAAEQLRDRPDIAFLMVGDGSEKGRLEDERQRRGLDNVLILGERPKTDMPSIWHISDISLVLLRRLDTFKSVLPSKIFEAMAMRRPIVLGVEGESRQLVEDAGAGIGITPEDGRELAEAVRSLAADPQKRAAMGDSGRRFVEEHFDRNKLADRYASFLEDVAREKDNGRS
jgi:glycosyltransferase involved in cell wall biosynthesis